jgi:hypothetical protein
MTISAQQAAGWLEQAELVLDSMGAVESRVWSAGSYEEQQLTDEGRTSSLRELGAGDLFGEQTKATEAEEDSNETEQSSSESENDESSSPEEEPDT